VCLYQQYFNESRPHLGLGQRVPTKPILNIDANCRSLGANPAGGRRHLIDRW
jgi:hypothetical protein